MKENNTNIYSALENRRDFLNKTLNNLPKNNDDNLTGQIRISSRNSSGRVQYYLREQADDKSGKYIKKSETHLIRRLLQNQYDEKILTLATQELHDINKFLSKHDHDALVDPYLKLPEEARRLITPVTIDDETYIKRWQNIPFMPKGFREDDKTEYYTAKNERVRSKSEINIANALNLAGIPYIYEFPVKLKNGIVCHPDFKILNVRERKTYYWEHLGKMNDNDYINTNMLRLQDLSNVGIVQGKNLILTFESLEIPLSSKVVQIIIDTILK